MINFSNKLEKALKVAAEMQKFDAQDDRLTQLIGESDEVFEDDLDFVAAARAVTPDLQTLLDSRKNK